MKKNLVALLALTFVALWAVIKFTGADEESAIVSVFTNAFISVALIGGIVGLFKSKEWGGVKSLLGRSLALLSLGLISTTIGSLTLSLIYMITNEEPSYPSIAEIFYFGGIALYILAVIYMAKTLKTWHYIKRRGLVNNLLILFVPILMILVLVSVYVMKHSIEESGLLAIVIDVAYSITQATYALIALAVLFSSRELYGGKLRIAVIILLGGLMLQYTADTNYSFQQLSGSWTNSGYGQLLYLMAYSTIAYSIQMFNLPKVQAKNEVTE